MRSRISTSRVTLAYDDDTGRYTLGPSQALDVENGKNGDDWLDIPGTESQETVVGVET